MNYLGLVNKVIEEGGAEMDLLQLSTWSSAEAGRRLYPRYKRHVAEAWKMIQMERNEWEFNTDELSTVVNPRIKFADGISNIGDIAVNSEFRGLVSNTIIRVTKVELSQDSPALSEGGAFGQIEFVVVNDGQSLRHGETLRNTNLVLGQVCQFIYAEKGSYSFLDEKPGLREPQWSTFVAGTNDYFPHPMTYIPWDNWIQKEYSWTGTSQSVPAYVSEDPSGRLVFYPQPLRPFQLNFWYDEEPQALVEPTDIPKEIPGEYHEWIAWRALMMVARFDKNPDLYAYASTYDTFYKNRAERNLMPRTSWAQSKYDRGSIV